MTETARKQRRQRQARRLQVRRRRGGALLTLAALVLLLASLAGTLAPAQATSDSGAEGVAPAAEGGPTAGGEAPSDDEGAGEEPEACPEGEVEVEATAGAEIACEPEADESEEGEGEAGETGGEEAEAEEAVESPAGDEAVEDAGSGEELEEPEAGGPAAGGEGGQGGGVVANAPLRAGAAGQRAGSGQPRRGGSGRSHPSGRRHGGGGRSGGTGAGAGAQSTGGTSPAPRGWSWSGAWAIPWQIVACESGGNYGALNASSGAGGAYQILPSTWREYGGAGAPQGAPPAEQDRVAAQIWADSGPAAWVCAQNGAWLGATLGPGQSGSLGPLPDPLPPARRLDPRFVALLTRTARAHHVGWAPLLAAVRLRGGRGHVPAGAAELRSVAASLAADRGAGLAARARLLFARPAAQRLLALTYYERAVGRRGLVEGLEAVKGRLERRVLASRRLLIYPGGREDVAAGRVDVRVLTLLLYLAQRYRSVTVSCLLSGHSYLTSSGNPSLHAFGRAVDIAALNGTPILGHQQPGGLTERALRRILLLPGELQPSELISLFDLGGPSFALPDHADHIHVGF